MFGHCRQQFQHLVLLLLGQSFYYKLFVLSEEEETAASTSVVSRRVTSIGLEQLELVVLLLDRFKDIVLRHFVIAPDELEDVRGIRFDDNVCINFLIEHETRILLSYAYGLITCLNQAQASS